MIFVWMLENFKLHVGLRFVVCVTLLCNSVGPEQWGRTDTIADCEVDAFWTGL